MENVTAEAVSTQTGNPVEQIAEMIAVNRRNNAQQIANKELPGGQEETKVESPQATTEEEVEPEESASEATEAVEEENAEESSEEAKNAEGANEPVNFFDFAEQNPDLKIRIPNKNADGGFVEITAKKAATLLGQTSDIDENSRKLKLQRAEFEEFESKRRQELDGLQIGLELTIAPQLQQAADEIGRAHV